jgi:hypothetical protein
LTGAAAIADGGTVELTVVPFAATVDRQNGDGVPEAATRFATTAAGFGVGFDLGQAMTGKPLGACFGAAVGTFYAQRLWNRWRRSAG